ncbi:lipid IV(A) 3-deoxy-D-manno-octulosonic acid transferase [Entomomonas asaccharolytica]|uniref:3-deoxy-D-manno-octulosonic acid transferase n=1 Tax=Entomomonas asaccharolytica TaxID=2785331 RepID=A0A974NEW7_9GAMM|nr:lipid IV(A) 3-deoxy-D-manno-octulosonic acid transferase [Entomomonas asaccharolytica]QQP85334.1 lipid IV(A) 3-deoxy-D-manno-octulosonic acid transferase [Entomomonas asaccharolytica]
MNRFLYSVLFYMALPVITGRLLWRARKAPAYKQRIAERFAFKLKNLKPHGIWIHAVSVGESIAAAPMINALLQDHPDLPITITCMTPTGSERIKSLFGDRVQHCYMPYDAPCIAKRFLKKLQPKVAIIMETELWPNHIFYCHQRGIPVVLANARLSERSAKGYAKFHKVTRPMFASINWIAVQTQLEADRFIELGAQPENVAVIGSIKFDINIESTLTKNAEELRKKWQSTDRPTWIAASTHAGEDEIVLEAHRQLLAQYRDGLLIIVPRHPERFKEVFELTAKHFNTIKRSDNTWVTNQTQVLVGDTMGELLFLYALADIAFVGGSLVDNGGHNVLEPVALHKPVICGPHLYNFQEITNQLREAHALAVVNNSQELFLQLKRLFENHDLIEEMVQGGNQIMQHNQGALERLVQGINQQLVS